MTRSPDRPGVVPATPENVRRAAECLKRGELVVVPTETVYGVAARADAPDAMARLYAAKGRDAAKRIALFAADLAAARAAGAQADEIAERLAAAFWPGPLTLVLPAAAGEWIGLRCPDHPVALAWLPRASPPDQAWPAPCSSQCSACMVFVSEERTRVRV